MAVELEGVENELETRGTTCRYENAAEVNTVDKTQGLVGLK